MALDVEVKDFGAWSDEIQSLKAAKESMEVASETIKKIIEDNLAHYGIDGPLAKKIVAKYNDDVLANSNKFISEVGSFIKKHETVMNNAATMTGSLDNFVKTRM